MFIHLHVPVNIYFISNTDYSAATLTVLPYENHGCFVLFVILL